MSNSPIIFEWLVYDDMHPAYVYSRTYAEGIKRLNIMFNILYHRHVCPYVNCRVIDYYTVEE